jgi:hypothetical protein
MKTKYGSCFTVLNVLNNLRFKHVALGVVSLLAAQKMTAQNEPPLAGGPAAAPPQSSPALGETAPKAALEMPAPKLQAPNPTKNEVSVSGDFLLAQGTISLPLGYSLKQALGGVTGFQPGAFSVPRDSQYYGGTISYSYGQAWYLDISYAQGESSGTQSIETGFLGNLQSNFNIQDEWYQAYIRYTFPSLRGKRLSAYMRGGVSYVTATLTDNASSPALGRYTQNDSTTDIMGNLGFGAAYSVYTSSRWRMGIQLEVEGFYGERNQDSLETLSADVGLKFANANIDNTLYGGIVRATYRVEYRLGKSGLFKVFGDVGVQVRYEMVDYPGGGSQDEMLWGPYVRLGVRYAF